MATNKTVTVTEIPTRTGDTVASYNAYSNIDGLLDNMSPAEAAAGHTVSLSDGVEHNITVKTVWTTAGESTTNVSNIVVVDLSGATIITPSDYASCELALLSNSIHPIDVSQATDGAGGNPVIAAHTGAGLPFTDPSNADGWNTFDGVDELTQHTTRGAVVGSNEGFTDLCYIKCLDDTPVVSTYPNIYTGVSNADNIGFNTNDSTYRTRLGADAATTNLITVASWSIGAKKVFGMLREASGDGGKVNLYLDGDLGDAFSSADKSANSRGVSDYGGNAGYSDRCMNVAIGRRIIFSQKLDETTTPKLSEAVAWVMAGDLE